MANNSAKFVPMCGRYSNAKDLAELMKLVDAVRRLGFVPRYNITPTQMARGAVSSAVAVHVTSRRWLFSLGI